MTRVGTAGLDDHVTINGVQVVLPNVLEPHNILMQALTPTAARPRLDAWYYGDGLPNVPDRFEWALEYDLDSDVPGPAIAVLERLRTRGGVHTFTDWKERSYTYTARTAQQFFYLPRQDAFSLGYTDHDDSSRYAAAVALNPATDDEPLTVVYKPTVSSADVVPAGEVWISNAVIDHPQAGFKVAPFKVGTPLAIYDEILVEFHALYRVAVTGVPTMAFAELAGREDKALYLAEVA